MLIIYPKLSLSGEEKTTSTWNISKKSVTIHATESINEKFSREQRRGGVQFILSIAEAVVFNGKESL